jgi:L-lactate dehydrogenase complex protein LldG
VSADPKEIKPFQNMLSLFQDTEADNTGQTKTMAIDVTFAENFVSQGGKFIYCENTSQLFLFLKSLQEQFKWNYIFSWNPALRNLMEKYEFQKDDPEMLIQYSDAAISFCDTLVAEHGVIVLSPDQSSNRKLTTFPKHHIIIASQNNLVATIEDAIKVFNNNYFNRLPAVLELNDDKKVYRSNHSRMLSADGTKDVYVFYVDTPQIG